MTQQVIETQQQAAPAPVEQQAPDLSEPTDADLIAAAREAGGAASVDVAAEEAAAKLAAGDTAPAGDATEADEPKIAAVLRAREKAFAERQGAQDYAAQLRQQAEKEAEEIRAEARKRAAADYEADLQARRAKFRETPGTAIRELGFSTDDMVDAVTREGTPEWKAMRQLQQELAEAKSKAGVVDSVKADFETFKEQMHARESRAALVAVEQQFLTVHASPEKAPNLHRRYDPEEIVAKAHALANQWTQAGVSFAHSDIGEYLEHQARQRLAGVPFPAQQVSAGGSGQKVRPATGSRTLSAAGGSERRAAPKPIEEMSPDEERAALIEAAAEARRTGG